MKHSSVFSLDLCRLQDQDFTPSNFVQLRKALMQYFRPSSFVREQNKPEEHVSSSLVRGSQMDSNLIKFYAIPLKKKDENPSAQHESYVSALWKLRDQVLSLHAHKQMPHKHYCAGFVKFFYFASCYLLYCFLSCRPQLVLIINKIQDT